ncbi:histone H2B.5-like isoform X1 [Juglans regia]|uniref:Histone H2B.5-like isoform X1 n=1 Tax=Juglans regia TaxID=51240 RepID=A0A6P9EDS2_JUGRE|nr:histone H2B.5-like isoform X1 [Juglans regia]
MAPKRSPKVMGTVMKTRSKVVREIVQVTVVERAQKPTIGEIDEEKEDTFIPSGRKPLRTIAVEDKSEQRNHESAQIPVLVEDKSSEQENQSFPVQVEGKSKEENQPVQPPVEKKSEEENQPVQPPVEEKQEEENQDKSPEENQAEVEVPEEEKEKQPTNMTSGKQEGPSKIEGKKKTKSTQEGEGKTRRRKRRRKEGGGEEYRRYVYRVLKQVHPELRVSSKAMTVLNNMMKDMFERLTEEAAVLSKYTSRKTLSSREIQGAVRLVLPGELGRHAIAEGSKAVTSFMSYIARESKRSS